MILSKITSPLRKLITRRRLCKPKLIKQTACTLIQNNYGRRFYSTSNAMKVTIFGAAGATGQSLSLMLKQSPLIDELCLYDMKLTTAFAADLNYVDTKCKVTSFSCRDVMKALQNTSVVVLAASAPYADRLQEPQIFDINAPIVRDLALDIAKYCPKAIVAVVTEPVEYMVPLVTEVLKKYGHYNPSAVIGVTSIDNVRANTFVAEVLGLEPETVFVPIVGGHTEHTIVPVLSQAVPCAEFTNEELEDITKSVREARSNIVQIKPTGTYTLSGAFSVARCVISIVKAMRGQPNIVSCAYVKSNVHPQLKYLVTPVMLGPGGVMKNLGLPDMTDYEACLFENMIPFLVEKIKKGEAFGGRKEATVCDECDPDPKARPCPPDHCNRKALTMGDK